MPHTAYPSCTQTLELVHADCEQLLSGVQGTAQLAARISSKVCFKPWAVNELSIGVEVGVGVGVADVITFEAGNAARVRGYSTPRVGAGLLM